MRFSLPVRLGLLLSVLALQFPSARAQSTRESVEEKFKVLDRNNDGIITPEELPIPKIFKFLDRDNDGKVTQDEAIAALPNGIPGGGALPGLALPAFNGPALQSPQGPHLVSASEVGIGHRVDDLCLTDLEGKQQFLSKIGGKNGLVIAFTSATCPVSKRYAPSLARLASSLSEKGIAMVFVDPFRSESADSVRTFLKEQGITSIAAIDLDGSVSRALQARSTAEVFLLDPTRTLLYRGALDDQYGISYSLDAPRQSYLQPAIEAMLAGRKVVVPATSAPGCELDVETVSKTAATTAKPVTFHNQIQRILQQNCAECHHEGGIAPFSLEDIAEVTDRAKTIRRVVEQGIMPPWFAVPTEDGKPSPWANDRSLPAPDKQALLAWLKTSERPLGNPADAPQSMKWPQGWSLGEPDAVLAFDQPVEVKAEGTMPYQNIVVPTNFDEDRWVSAVEVQPGARDVVHHIIVSIMSKAEVDAGKARGHVREGDPGSYFAVFVPGTSGERSPTGMAKKLPAGSFLRFQVHYTPNGKATTDLTRIGLHFTKETPRWEMRTAAAINTRILIPPGAAAHREVAYLPVMPNVLVLGFFPHMHVRGKAFKYELVNADGTSRTLLDIPRYDFNWQLGYQLAEPFVTTAGTVLRATAWYDNSPANKANPDRTKAVHWGPQTSDEMMLGYVKYAVPITPANPTAQR